MVLGLGSRSKKDRGSAISQLVELELHLHEIKPWLGPAKPSKIPVKLALSSGRGGKVIGSSRNLTFTPSSVPEAGKLIIGESLRIAVAPNREVLKRAKKSYPDLDEPVVFSLLDMNDPKGKPLAQATLDLSSLASIAEPKAVAIPFSISKKLAKGPTAYVHVTVQKHQDDRPSSPAASASLGTSDRTSDASSLPPLDEDTQQRLVAALLSDSEDNRNIKEDDIDSFTDDDDEGTKRIVIPVGPQDTSSSQGNEAFRQPQQNATSSAGIVPAGITVQRADISLVQGIAEKQPDTQASPVKAAAIAAAAAYTKKYTFLPRRTESYMNDSDNSSSDVDSAGEDDFSPGFSKRAQSLRLPKGLPKAGTYLQANASSARGVDTLSNHSVEKSTNKEAQSKVDVRMDTKNAAKVVNVEDAKSKLNGQYTSLEVTTMQEAKVPTKEKIGLVAKDEPNDLVETILTASVVSNSSHLAKESNASSMGLRSVSEDSLKSQIVLQRSFSDENDVSQKIERIPSKLSKRSESDTLLRTQAKLSPEQKSKPTVKIPSRGQQRNPVSKIQDPVKVRTNQSAGKDFRASQTVMQDAKAKLSTSLDSENERIDRKETEEIKEKSLFVEGKGPSLQQKVQQMEAEVEKLKGELRDVAAVEAALYSTTAEHGSSSMKLHAPARRLARVYLYSCKRCSPERSASCARTIMSGLVLTARACGNDVARLTFWWSNAVVLREIISTATKTLPGVPRSNFSTEKKNDVNSPNGKMYQKQQIPSAGHAFEDWRELSYFIAALERLESWIYTKVVESIWWQVLTPQMQQPKEQVILDIDDTVVDVRPDYGKREKKRVIARELEDAQQGNVSLEIWKKAFLDAYERLCPVRVLGVECGCLPMLNRLVVEACVGRLDVAMFNAILRDDEAPTDPVSDPISYVTVLPIPNSSLSFGRGAQLKNMVATLSSFINSLTKKADDAMSDAISDDDEQSIMAFPMLKAMGGLLMLPKEMLMDKALRKEVCPTLEISFIARILSKFQPDEFSPEPIASELLDTINSEVAAEQEDRDYCASTARTAFSPSVVYNPPQSSMVSPWIGDHVSTDSPLRRSNSSILRKGHTSDDELDELESPIAWLWDNTRGSNCDNGNNNVPSAALTSLHDGGGIRRFMLLKEVWSSSR